MKILTTPWKKKFLELVHQSKRSIKITSPYVKSDICNELINAKNNFSKIELITSVKLMSIYSGSLDISAIESIIENKGVVKNFQKLHSKIYLFDESKAIITSGNMTYGGMMKNYEYGIYLDEQKIVKRISNDFDFISQNEKIGIVKKSDLDIIKSILEKIPKSVLPKLPSIKIETPEENLDVIETPIEPIKSSLSGWKLEVFKCVNSIPKQIFTLREVNRFEKHFSTIYPDNKHITDKIRQQLQELRDLGLIEFLGTGNYKKYGMKNKNGNHTSFNFFNDKEYFDFIEDYEDKWLQYATKKEKMKAFFGNEEKAYKEYILWLTGKEPFSDRKEKLFRNKK